MKRFTIEFSAQGTVRQDVEIDDDSMTAEKLLIMLRNGDALTTIQEGGTIDLLAGVSLGKVVNVDNELEYTDFEIE